MLRKVTALNLLLMSLILVVTIVFVNQPSTPTADAKFNTPTQLVEEDGPTGPTFTYTPSRTPTKPPTTMPTIAPTEDINPTVHRFSEWFNCWSEIKIFRNGQVVDSLHVYTPMRAHWSENKYTREVSNYLIRFGYYDRPLVPVASGIPGEPHNIGNWTGIFDTVKYFEEFEGRLSPQDATISGRMKVFPIWIDPIDGQRYPVTLNCGVSFTIVGGSQVFSDGASWTGISFGQHSNPAGGLNIGATPTPITPTLTPLPIPPTLTPVAPIFDPSPRSETRNCGAPLTLTKMSADTLRVVANYTIDYHQIGVDSEGRAIYMIDDYRINSRSLDAVNTNPTNANPRIINQGSSGIMFTSSTFSGTSFDYIVQGNDLRIEYDTPQGFVREYVNWSCNLRTVPNAN